jgi:hypothetical protein
MALALQGTALAQRVPPFVAEAFCGAGLTDSPGFVYALAGAATDVLIKRAMPLA